MARAPGSATARRPGMPPAAPSLPAAWVHPHLIPDLAARGATDIGMFNNVIGVGDNELKMDAAYPETIVAGMGLNVVNRLIQVGDYMGYDRIDVFGADCALGEDGAWHMDGSTGDKRQILTATINGRKWATFFDMAYSAGALGWQKRVLRNRLRIIGNTMPAAILADPRDKRDPDRFLRPLPSFNDKDRDDWNTAMRAGRVSWSLTMWTGCWRGG